MNFTDRIKLENNRGYVIAGGAAIIAFIAFFLPYISVSSVLGSISANGAAAGSWLWLSFLGALIVLAISTLFVLRDNLLSGTINMPIGQQIKIGKYVLLGVSVVTLLIHLLFLIGYSASGLGSYSGFGVSVSLGFGAWLFLLAAIAMTVGSVLALRKPAAAAQTYGQQYSAQGTQYPPQPMQYPPYQQPNQQQPQQPYQPYPQQPQQYPPTEMQPPPQQR